MIHVHLPVLVLGSPTTFELEKQETQLINGNTGTASEEDHANAAWFLIRLHKSRCTSLLEEYLHNVLLHNLGNVQRVEFITKPCAKLHLV